MPDGGRPLGRTSAHRTLRRRSPRGLERINEPHIDLVVWRRSLPVALHDWLEPLPARQLPQGRVLATADKLPAALAELIAASRTPNGLGARILIDDVIDLASRFARITRSKPVDVGLEAVDDNACWRFHRDCVPLRLLTTYRGPGTQIVAPRFAMRALCQQRQYDGPVEELTTGAVAVFKGDHAGGVHRSPPIKGSHVTRLVLTLNLPSAVSPPLWS